MQSSSRVRTQNSGWTTSSATQALLAHGPRQTDSLRWPPAGHAFVREYSVHRNAYDVHMTYTVHRAHGANQCTMHEVTNSTMKRRTYGSH